MTGEWECQVLVGDVEVVGVGVGGETRCAHYASTRDVVALKFACCGRYYPCFRCHEAFADHDLQTWPRSSCDERAVLCGSCGGQLTIREYLETLGGDATCPRCKAEFNPGCLSHRDRYFDVPDLE